jgi:hypothetical protein
VERRVERDDGEGYEEKYGCTEEDEESNEETGRRAVREEEEEEGLLNLVFLRDIMGGGSIFPFS